MWETYLFLLLTIPSLIFSLAFKSKAFMINGFWYLSVNSLGLGFLEFLFFWLMLVGLFQLKASTRLSFSFRVLKWDPLEGWRRGRRLRRRLTRMSWLLLWVLNQSPWIGGTASLRGLLVKILFSFFCSFMWLHYLFLCLFTSLICTVLWLHTLVWLSAAMFGLLFTRALVENC